MSVSPALAKTPLSISTSSPVNGVSPVTPLTPLTNGLSRSSSQQNVDTDSGKSSCSPALLDCSFDSGIVMAVNDLQMHKRIQQCKRILIALERDKEAYRKLRERLSKIVDKKSKKHKTEPENCNVCCTAIALDDTKSFVKCCLCNKHICRNLKCADWLPQAAQWECQLCHSTKESLAHTSSWVADQMSFNQQKLTYPMRARSEIYIPINDCNDSFMQFESVSQIGLNTNDAISNEQKQKIREYVEEVVASMLGGSLDSIKVNQMSKSENYLQLFIRYHKKMSNILLLLENALQYKALKGDLPAVINGHNITAATSPTNNNNHNDLADISQTRLKQLIEAIITETLRLPVLSSNAVSEVSLDTRSHADTAPPLTNGHTRRHRVEHYFEPKNYQDLLATAVLNKIVDKQNNGRLLSESTPELHVGGHGIDRNFNVETQSTASGSSVEPRSDCSLTDTETADKDAADFRNLGFGRESALSDYVASHMVPLPDLSAPVTESDEDDYASVTSSMVGEGTWADNWLFKKKKPAVNSPILAGGNGMLVPAPKEDIRAQIGDKTTDEISDLSEMGSDTEDSSLDVMHANLDPLNDRLLNKQLIGGQNSKIILDELIETASSISATPTIEIKPTILETTNAHVVDNIAKTEAINLNVTNAQFNPLSGSIAEREHMKWNNAVEMPNNPYAPDALKRRISGSQEKTIDFPNISPSTEQNTMDLLKTDTEPTEQEQQQESDYKRYSRDYYINDVQPAKSCPKRQTAFEITLSANIDEPATDNIVINESEHEKKIEVSTEIEPIKTFNETITLTEKYQAIPAQVVEEPISIDTLSNPSLQSVNTTTSEESDTVRIYDFNKQETTVMRDAKSTAAETTATTKTITTVASTTSTDTVTTETEDSGSTTISIETQSTVEEDAMQHSNQTPKPIFKKERPTELQFGAATSSATTTPYTPTRGSTPSAFKFLQPKRKLIEPSQVLSFDEDETPLTTVKATEKPVIEKEIVHAMPSVKALAQAFLMTSNKSSIQQKRWGKAKTLPDLPKKILIKSPVSRMETSPSFLDANETESKSTSIESEKSDPIVEISEITDEPEKTEATSPTTETKESSRVGSPTESTNDTSPTRSNGGVLKNKIALFENLKNVK